MKIYGADPRPIKDSKVRSNASSPGKKGSSLEGKAGSESGSEKVVLSSPKEIQLAKEVIANSPDIRSEKVNEIKSQIDRGEYFVDSKQIAGKMLKNLLLE